MIRRILSIPFVIIYILFAALGNWLSKLWDRMKRGEG